jgi:hypothetical protein
MRADDSAGGADHARAKGRHRHGIDIAIHIEHRRVVAELADDPSDRTPCARILASVIGGHGSDWEAL